MIKVDVESSFEPIIGSELQSKELIKSLTEMIIKVRFGRARYLVEVLML
jgi:hypothetical protein